MLMSLLLSSLHWNHFRAEQKFAEVAHWFCNLFTGAITEDRYRCAEKDRFWERRRINTVYFCLVCGGCAMFKPVLTQVKWHARAGVPICRELCGSQNFYFPDLFHKKSFSWRQSFLISRNLYICVVSAHNERSR